VDYQVHTGPALGAFNQWVKGTSLEDWRKRQIVALKAEEIAQLIVFTIATRVPGAPPRSIETFC